MRRFAGAGPTDTEMLLPWYVAGTLDRHAARQVELALAHDVEVRRQCELVCEELTETIRLNESLGAPSARARERLKAALVASTTK
jgi:anti-sigma-K factor RskA